MPHKLHDLIVEHIQKSGPLSVAAYMDLCLAHPELGYYRRKDPLGVKGDFTTAPEISQLFGEMIGIWVADSWLKLGSPERLILVECGPGRGTLMADILRVAKKVPGLPEAISVQLIETSPALIEKQKDLLAGQRITWHAGLSTLPKDAPVIFIGNEFLDALPFYQVVKTAEGWRERMVTLENGKLIFALGPGLKEGDFPDAKEGGIFEFSPPRESIWADICARVKSQKGAALLIDYGHSETKIGDTFQAVKDHQFANVLENPGEQDLTSHVDFARLKSLAGDLKVWGPIPQMYFLKNIGIEVRAEKLSAANPDKNEMIATGLRRLTHRDEMGLLFKVIGISHGMEDPAGFAE